MTLHYSDPSLEPHPDIRVVHGNILRTSMQALVVPVNLVGVMGAGLAKQVRDAHPWVDVVYRRMCDGTWQMGHIRRVSREEMPEREFWLFPTKHHWRDPSNLDYIDVGLRNLVRECLWLPPESLAIPALGCGFGGLSWDDVLPKLKWHLSRIPYSIPIEIYEPFTSQHIVRYKYE